MEVYEKNETTMPIEYMNILNYYGDYNGNEVMYIQSYMLESESYPQETIGGYNFNFTSYHTSIFVNTDDAIYRIDEAYDEGLLTSDQNREIGIAHMGEYYWNVFNPE